MGNLNSISQRHGPQAVFMQREGQGEGEQSEARCTPGGTEGPVARVPPGGCSLDPQETGLGVNHVCWHFPVTILWIPPSPPPFRYHESESVCLSRCKVLNQSPVWWHTPVIQHAGAEEGGWCQLEAILGHCPERAPLGLVCLTEVRWGLPEAPRLELGPGRRVERLLLCLWLTSAAGRGAALWLSSRGSRASRQLGSRKAKVALRPLAARCPASILPLEGRPGPQRGAPESTAAKEWAKPDVVAPACDLRTLGG